MSIRNEGTVDRVVRIVLGVALLAFGLFTRSWVGAIGVVPLLTGAVGFCPLYRLIGVQTCERPAH